MDNYTDMLAAARDNIRTSFGNAGKGAVLQVIDTIIGTNANQASSSGINAPQTQEPTDGKMQVG